MRRADKTTTARFTDDDGDWIELRTAFSVADRDLVQEAQQAIRISSDDGSTELRTRVHQGRRTLFEIMIVAWSLTDDDDRPLDPTADEYAKLELQSGNWVDERIDEVLADRAEQRGKGRRSSRTRRGSRSKTGASAPTT